GLDVGGDVLGQAFEMEVPQVVLDHASFTDASRGAHELDRHLHLDLLVPGDAEEVDVQYPPPDVVPLDLSRHGQDGLLVHLEIDQDVCSGVRVQQVEELAAIHRDVERLGVVPIDDGGHSPARSDLVRRLLADGVAKVGFHRAFHGDAPYDAFELAGRPGAWSREWKPAVIVRNKASGAVRYCWAPWRS